MATRKAEKKAEELRISQIGDFKKRLGGLMQLPSGAVVKTRNPGGLRVFMDAGVIPNSLMAMIQKSLKSGIKPSAEDIMPDGELDPQMINDMTALLDHIAIKCIVEPPVNPVPTEADMQVWNKNNPDEQITDPEELRSDDQLYIDEFPDIDKQFLFQWISGGTRDLETFRQKHEQSVASLATVANNASNTKLNSGSNAG